MKKTAVIDMNKCDPHKCNPEKGTCLVISACTHNILEQEEPFEPPILFSETMCVGCGDCVSACPLGAITISHGAFS